jgi:hypothetical protein
MIRPLIKVIRLAVIRGVTALPPQKGISPRDCSECKKLNTVWVVTSMEKTRGSWIVESLHVLTWLHPRNDHSIEPCKTVWSCCG